MIFGFVGAAKGLSPRQFHEVLERTARLPASASAVVGTGLGAPEMIGAILRGWGGNVTVLASSDPLDLTNAQIVDECTVLVACPSGPPSAKSPTWKAIRYARFAGRRIVVIAADGTVTKEGR